MKMFAIRNKETGELFVGNRGTILFHGPGHAKQAWGHAQRRHRYIRNGRFDDEAEGLEVVEYTAIPTAELEELQEADHRLQDLEK